MTGPDPRIKQVPPTGPSDEALERFGRAIAAGLHNTFPDYEFIVRRREPPGDSAPEDGEPGRRN